MTPSHEVVSPPKGSPLATYVARDVKTAIAGTTYPLANDLSRQKRDGYLLMIEAEMGRIQSELDDVREVRRKLRDMVFGGMVAVVAAIAVMISGDMIRLLVGSVGYMLAVFVQIAMPLKLFVPKQAEEYRLQADLERLRRLRVEFSLEEEVAVNDARALLSVKDLT